VVCFVALYDSYDSVYDRFGKEFHGLKYLFSVSITLLSTEVQHYTNKIITLILNYCIKTKLVKGNNIV